MAGLWPSVDVRPSDTTRRLRPAYKSDGSAVLDKRTGEQAYTTCLRLPEGTRIASTGEGLGGWMLSFFVKPSDLSRDAHGRPCIRPDLETLTVSLNPERPVQLFRRTGRGEWERRLVGDESLTANAVWELCGSIGSALADGRAEAEGEQPEKDAPGRGHHMPFGMGDLLSPKAGVEEMLATVLRDGTEGIAAAQAIMARASEQAARAFAAALAEESVAAEQACESSPEAAGAADAIKRALGAGQVVYDAVAEVALVVEGGTLWAAHVQRTLAEDVCRGRLADDDPARMDRRSAIVRDPGDGQPPTYDVRGAGEAMRDLALGSRKARMWEWGGSADPRFTHVALACDGAVAVGPSAPGATAIECVARARELERSESPARGAAEVIEAARGLELDSKPEPGRAGAAK